MWKQTLLVALIASSALAAPPPKARPGMSKEQEALFKEAEAAEQDIDHMTEGWSTALKEGKITKEQYLAETQKTIVRHRQLAEKYTRLAESMREAPRKQRDMVALKAAKAWCRVVEPGKALPLFDEVARQSQAAQSRVEALYGSCWCRMVLKKPRELPGLLERAKKELPSLKQDEREAAERWIKVAAGFAAAARE